MQRAQPKMHQKLTCTIVGSSLLPSLNSSYVNRASLLRSILRKILSTLYTPLVTVRKTDSSKGM